MNGWTVALLLGDLAATAGVVVWAYRVDPLDGTPDDLARKDLRQVRVAEAGLDGALFAVIILGRSGLGALAVLALVSLAVIAGRAFRMALAFHFLGDEKARELEPRAGAVAAVLALTVLIAVGLSAVPASRNGYRTRAQRDSDLFGVHVLNREVAVPTRVVPHPPVTADAGLADGIAVPVRTYHLDGAGWLLLLVPHELTCVPAVVLLAADSDGTVDVAVVYRPGPLTRMPDGSLRGTTTPAPAVTPTPTAAPSPLPASVCRTDAGHGLPVHSSVRVPVPRALFPTGHTARAVRDTAAGGPAMAR